MSSQELRCTTLLIEEGAAQEFCEAISLDWQGLLRESQTFVVEKKNDIPDLSTTECPVLLVFSLIDSIELIQSLNGLHKNLELIGILEDTTNAAKLLMRWQKSVLGESRFFELEKSFSTNRHKSRSDN